MLKRGWAFLGLALGLLTIPAVIVSGCSLSQSKGLSIGDKAPAFRLPAAEGGEVSLDGYLGKKPVLLYFHMAYG